MNTQIAGKQIHNSEFEADNIFQNRNFYSKTHIAENLDRCASNLLHLKKLVSVFESRNDDVFHKSIFVLRTSYEFTIYKDQATIHDRINGTAVTSTFTCPFAFAHEVSQLYRNSISNIDSFPVSEFGFEGGLIGYLGYGLTELSLDIERQKERFMNLPDAIMFIPGCFVEIDHVTGQVRVVSDQNLEECDAVIQQIQINAPSTAEKNNANRKVQSSIEGQTNSMTEADFIEKISRIKEHIKTGDAFQIVLSNRITVPISTNALELYKELVSSSQSMYNYYFDFGQFQYIGASPESFILIDNNNASFKALAGTRPRGATRLEDESYKVELTNCPKENAEHMMLVDLGRNDLGRVCEPGSVQVKSLKEIVKNTHVMHLSSEINGYLKKNINAFEAIKSCFPRGTVSGAPKRRALKILSTLENEQRGIYSGCIGFIDINDNVNLAIAIRGATIKGHTAHIQSGAGIVYDSVASLEYQETIHKANSILKPIKRLKH